MRDFLHYLGSMAVFGLVCLVVIVIVTLALWFLAPGVWDALFA